MTNNKRKAWICRTEQLFINLGAVLIHDGLKNPGQFEFPPDEVGFYTRYYQCKMDGQFISTWVLFKYDKRTGWADFEVTHRDPRTGKKEIERRRLKMSETSEAREVFRNA